MATVVLAFSSLLFMYLKFGLAEVVIVGVLALIVFLNGNRNTLWLDRLTLATMLIINFYCLDALYREPAYNAAFLVIAVLCVLHDLKK